MHPAPVEKFRLSPTAMTLTGFVVMLAVALLGALAAFFSGVALALLGLPPALSGLLSVGVFSGGSLMLLYRMNPTRVSVGLDGVLVRRIGNRRFVPLARLHGVRLHAQESQAEAGAVVHSLRLSLRSGSLTLVDDRATLQAVARAIEARRKPAKTELPVELERARMETPSEAASRVLALQHREANYRSATTSATELWEVLEVPGTELTVRILACLALGPEAGKADGARVRALRRCFASPRSVGWINRALRTTRLKTAVRLLKEVGRRG